MARRQSGCSSITNPTLYYWTCVFKSAAKVPGEAACAGTPANKDANPADPVVVQQALLRFSDEFATSLILDIDKLSRGTNPVAPADVLRWKINLTSQIFSIASGPSAVVNLLDMTAFVTVIRAPVEEHWEPKVFGESAQPMLDTCREAEKKIWLLADKMINPKQQVELRAAIEAIVKDLQSQEKQLTPLVDQVRQTLSAGTQMSTSLNTTIATFDGLMKRFGVGETSV
jgi:hypothetical protein